MPWSAPGVLEPLGVVWEYMRLVHPPVYAEAILTLGSFDVQAAVHAAALWKRGLAPVIVMSGGLAHRGGLLDTGWSRSEAQVFAEAAMAQGVPETALLLEEAGRMLGATRLRTLKDITAPLLRSAAIATWCFIFVGVVRELSAAVILFTSETKVLSVLIFDLKESGDVGAIAVLSLTMVILTTVVIVIANRIGGIHSRSTDRVGA